MSDAPHFDPSMLEGKGKDELATIATSLGKKPPARAKKSDVIALIMELVGASASPDGTADGAGHGEVAEVADRSDAPGTTRDAAADAPVSDGAVGASDDSPVSPDGDHSIGAEAAETVSVSGVNPASGFSADSAEASPMSHQAGRPDRDETRAAQDADRLGHDQGGANRYGGRPSASNNHDRDSGRGQVSSTATDAARADHPNQTDPNRNRNPNATSGDSGDGEGDDGESANRRRRRRGRERRPESEGGEPGQGQPEPVVVEGLVELRDEGYGFLRLKGYLPSRDDAYISVKQTRQFGLRTGDVVAGRARAANRNEKNPALLQVERVNGHPSHQQPPRRRFEDLTPLFPDERLKLELSDDPANATARIIDLVAPIGKGQRGLIVSPPKAGKTTVVKHMVRSIEVNHPEVELLVLLVDERPEEVTDMRRWLVRGTVAASTFDRPADEHITVAELVIERAKRLVEDGKDVVVILDGITRLARAYNLAAPATGRIMAGGIDTGALYPPKKFFGAARNAEEGGSLTIIATALVETNTRMDEVIFEEFKGTGNMELKLDRKLAERRIFPAIDVDASSTRHEELLFTRQQLPQVWRLRRVLGALRDDSGSSAAGIEMLTDRLQAFKSNEAFLAEVAKTTS